MKPSDAVLYEPYLPMIYNIRMNISTRIKTAIFSRSIQDPDVIRILSLIDNSLFDTEYYGIRKDVKGKYKESTSKLSRIYNDFAKLSATVDQRNVIYSSVLPVIRYTVYKKQNTDISSIVDITTIIEAVRTIGINLLDFNKDFEAILSADYIANTKILSNITLRQALLTVFGIRKVHLMDTSAYIKYEVIDSKRVLVAKYAIPPSIVHLAHYDKINYINLQVKPKDIKDIYNKTYRASNNVTVVEGDKLKHYILDITGIRQDGLGLRQSKSENIPSTNDSRAVYSNIIIRGKRIMQEHTKSSVITVLDMQQILEYFVGILHAQSADNYNYAENFKREMLKQINIYSGAGVRTHSNIPLGGGLPIGNQ